MLIGFQSHAGSIEACPECIHDLMGLVRFNPTLVRLRHSGPSLGSGI